MIYEVCPNETCCTTISKATITIIMLKVSDNCGATDDCVRINITYIL